MNAATAAFSRHESLQKTITIPANSEFTAILPVAAYMTNMIRVTHPHFPLNFKEYSYGNKI